jgi:hypothetical protein
MHMEIITRAEAVAKGLRHYFTGKPCRRGHMAPRVLLGGTCGVCTECKKINQADWREDNREQHNSWRKRNPEQRAKSQKKYLETHPERRKKSSLDWIKRNLDHHRAYQRELNKRRQREDPDYRFRKNLRSRLHKAVTRASVAKSGKTMDLIGCTVAELKLHLERQFSVGMAWDNYGHGAGRWNIDHRIPCASFDLTDPEQQRHCFHFSNLQPMWHPENVAKGDRVECLL